jgi:hypothetical protein
MSMQRFFFILIGLTLLGCQPSESAPDLLKTQRDTLNKAKAVDGQLQKQADEQRKSVEESQK